MKSVNGRATHTAVPAQISSTGLVIEGTSSLQRLLGFLDSVLRGIGQVMLQNNSYAGLLFLIGIFYNSRLFGWAVLLGTTASTATAVLLGVKRVHLRAGLFGFNGALVAIALLYFLEGGGQKGRESFLDTPARLQVEEAACPAARASLLETSPIMSPTAGDN